MSQGSTDFSTYTTGVQPSDWTRYNTSVDTFTVEAGTTPIGSKLLQITVASRWAIVRWDAAETAITADSSGDTETLSLLRVPDGFSGYFSGAGAVSKHSGDTNGYDLVWNYDSVVTLQKGGFSTWVHTSSDTASATAPTSSQWFWVRLRVNSTGNYVRGWVWLDGDTPKTNADTPDVELTSESSYVPLQYVGIGLDSNSSEGKRLWCAYHSYGTNGDAAPLPGSGAAAPSITNVNGDDSLALSETNNVITGTDFDSATVEIRQGGFTYTPAIDSQSATTIQFDMSSIGASGPIDAPHAGSATLAVINGDAQEDTLAITITDDATTETYLVGTPNADPGVRLTATPDYESGDYVRISNVVGGTISDVTIYPDLSFNVAESVTSFDHQPWDADDGTYGNRQTQEITSVSPSVPEITSGGGGADASNYEWELFMARAALRRQRERRDAAESAIEQAKDLPQVEQHEEVAAPLVVESKERKTDLRSLERLVRMYADPPQMLAPRARQAYIEAQRKADDAAYESLLLEIEAQQREEEEFLALAVNMIFRLH